MQDKKNTHVIGFSILAFTLAEVLITLGIIGVVAVLTIPNLVKNYQKNQTVTQLKKTFSVLSQVLTQSIVDNGEVTTWDWGTATSNTNTTRFVEAYILPYLSVAKNCAYSTAGDCARPLHKYIGGTSSSSAMSAYYVVLNDGTNLYFSVLLPGTAYDGVNTYVDINGNKPPNIFGKDTFYLTLYRTKAANKRQQMDFYGAGYGTSRNGLVSSANWGCNKNDTTVGAGLFCGALIQLDNWQIKDDYPWD